MRKMVIVVLLIKKGCGVPKYTNVETFSTTWLVNSRIFKIILSGMQHFSKSYYFIIKPVIWRLKL